jgi:hypothetical protein
VIVTGLALVPLSGAVVEVFCRCAPATASERFAARVRHPGHTDDEAPDDLKRATSSRPRLPVGTLGPVIEVDTERPADVGSIAEQVLATIGETT